MDSIHKYQKPLPDPEAFTPGDKPRREENIVLDSQGKERQAPDVKEAYKQAQERRRQNPNK